MQDLFTYASLGTLAGSVAATVLVVDFVKDFRPLKRLSTRFLVVMAAEAVVILTHIAAGKFKVVNFPLCILNGLLVAASAMRIWQVAHDRMFGNSAKTKGG